MSGPLVIRQQPTAGDIGAIDGQLTDAFAQMRSAVLDGRPVVVVLEDRDLLGQGHPADAAVATALLGIVRAFALEGARDGWRVNAVARRGEDAPVDDAIGGVLAVPTLSGQLIRLGTEHLGKVVV